MTQNFINTFEANLITIKKLLNLQLGDIIQGCSNDDVEFLEKKYAVTFPSIYKIFLKHFGHCSNSNIFRENIRYYDDLTWFGDEGVKELTEDGTITATLPEKAFFIGFFQNEQFWFIVCDESEDPNVYELYFEYDSPIFTEKLSSFILSYLQQAYIKLDTEPHEVD